MTRHYSWELKSTKVAIKTLDKSAFLHHGTGIPLKVREYFDIDNLDLGSKKNITLIYHNVPFDARIEMGNKRKHDSREVREESRLFWKSDLEKVLRNTYPHHFDLFSDGNKIADEMRPLMRFEKVRNRNNTYYLTFINPDEPFEERKYSWKEAVLMYVRELPGVEFKLKDIYSYEKELSNLFPKNTRIRPKIRQQLQYLRDEGYIEFLTNRGQYRKLFETEEDYRYMNELMDQIDAKQFRAEDSWGLTKTRMGQNIFRSKVLWHFEYQCCICQFNIESMLDAHHIHPWSVDYRNRLNPANGLSLCKLHHSAIDKSVIKINRDHVVRVSDRVKNSRNEMVHDSLARYHNQHIVEPREIELLI